MKAGKPLELTATINKFAEPIEAVWQKDNNVVVNAAKTTYSNGQCMLKIDSCTLVDTGEYSVTVQNPSGSSKSFAKITVIRMFTRAD